MTTSSSARWTDAIIDELDERLRRAPRLDEHRWSECAAIAARYKDGVSAWEALAANGYVPESWIADPSRWFTLPSQFYRRKRALEWVDPSMVTKVRFGLGYEVRAASSPVDRAWAAMIAAMAPILAEVEALAIESMHRARTLWISSKPKPTPNAPPSIITWTPRARSSEPVIPWITTARASTWYFTAYGKRGSNLPALPPHLEDAIAERIGTAAEWDISRILGVLQARGFDRATVNAIAGLYLGSRVFRALREVAGDTAIALTDSAYVKDIVVPPRSEVIDPIEPFISVIERGCRLVTAMGDGIALSTPVPRAIETPKRARP